MKEDEERPAHDHLEFRNNSFNGPFLGTGVQYNFASITTEIEIPDPRRWEKVRAADQIAMGVHAARSLDGNVSLPPYIWRDHDDLLEENVSQVSTQGGLLIAVGDSGAGKSRSLFSAMQRLLPRHRLLAPPHGANLQILPSHIQGYRGDCVIWLDDLEGYLGPQGLQPAVLTALANIRVPVLATMSDAMYEKFRPLAKNRAPAFLLGAPALAQVLDMALLIHIEREWTSAELERAAGCTDLRIQEALEHHGPYGIAEYLTAGPDLWALWKGARRSTHSGGHPRGHAIIASAIAIARMGFLGPIPPGLLHEAHTHYLESSAHLAPESFESAMEWCKEFRYGATSLLVHGSPIAGWGWKAFPYLADRSDRSGTHDTPRGLWEVALNHARTDRNRLLIGQAAYASGEHRIAGDAWTELAERGNPEAMFELGGMLADKGEEEQADAWFDKAIDAFCTRATFTLDPFTASEQGIWLLQQCAEAGDSYAARELAHHFVSWGELAEGERYFRIAAERGDDVAANNLGMMLAARGEMADSEKWLRKAASGGIEDASHNLKQIQSFMKSRAHRPGHSKESGPI
ncbi:tetratricopeptide repeat protein [Streptomyces microflavus]|uniref:tetratricopeptide repeat protein n=1 Tax=Streptomyces microflavus TaxID=1919 RepID=UPI002E2ECA59|nr:tetratricopeptide repeat protein [Streptomyces microflavus]